MMDFLSTEKQLLTEQLSHFFPKLISSIKTPPLKTILDPILDIKRLNDKEFKTTSHPVVIDNVATHWNALSSWKMDQLEQSHGENLVYSSSLKEKLKLSYLINQLKKNPNSSLKFYPLFSIDQIQSNIDLKWLKQNETPLAGLRSFQIFISPAETSTQAHSAPIGNFFIQIEGNKEWWVFANNISPIIHSNPVKHGRRTSPFNPKKICPNETGCAIKAYRTILRPGEILWVPPYAWHFVYNPTHSVGVSYRFISIANNLAQCPTLTLVDLISGQLNMSRYIKSLLSDRYNSELENGRYYKKLMGEQPLYD